MSGDRLKVGAVAARTGLSVRTLHHYDEIGLLAPSERTDSGHRVYGPDQLARLQRIQSLRQLGFSLGEIGRVLDDPEVSIGDILSSHRSRAEEHIGRLSDLRDRLRRLERILETGGASSEALIETLKATTMTDEYFTQEQLQQLEARREIVGEEEIESVQTHWGDLAGRVTSALEEGLETSDERALELAREWRQLTRRTMEGFTGGDEGLTGSVAKMWKEKPDTGMRWGMGPEVFAFMTEAMKLL